MYSEEQLRIIAEVTSKMEMRSPPSLTCDEQALKEAICRMYELPPPMEEGTSDNNDRLPMIWCDGPFQLLAIPLLMQLLVHRIKRLGASMICDVQTASGELLDSLSVKTWRVAGETLVERVDQQTLLRLASAAPPFKNSHEPRWYDEYCYSLLGIPTGPKLDGSLPQSTKATQRNLKNREHQELFRRLSVAERTLRETKSLFVLALRSEHQLETDFQTTLKPEHYRNSSSTWLTNLSREIAEQLLGTDFEDIVLSLDLQPPRFSLSGLSLELSDLAQQLNYILFGGLHTAFWGTWQEDRLFMEIAHKLFPDKIDSKTAQLLNDQALLFASVFAFVPLSRVIFLCRQPTTLAFDTTGHLHCEDGPCIEFADGTTVFALHGVIVPAAPIQDRQQLTSLYIDTLENVEQRRVLLELFGAARYLQECGATVIHKDNFGILYSIPMRDDEPVVMVQVTNSTPEPDGTFREYFLRVPPAIRRAREAVAWSFGMKEHEYNPEHQT